MALLGRQIPQWTEWHTQVCENSTFPQLRWRTVIMKTIHLWKNSEVFNCGRRRHNSSFTGVTSKVDLFLSFSMNKNQHFFLPYFKPHNSFWRKWSPQITLFSVTSKAPKQGCNFHSFIFCPYCKRFGSVGWNGSERKTELRLNSDQYVQTADHDCLYEHRAQHLKYH